MIGGKSPERPVSCPQGLLNSPKCHPAKMTWGKSPERPVSCPQGPFNFQKMTSGKNDLGQKPRTTSVMPAGAFKFPQMIARGCPVPLSRPRSGFKQVLGGQKLANTAPAHQTRPPDDTAPDPPDLQFPRNSSGSIRRNPRERSWTASRDPPNTRAGGQDDMSSETNSLKIKYGQTQLSYSPKQ